MSNRNAPRRAFFSRCAALLIATTALGACASPADNAVGESSSSESAPSSAMYPAELQLDYTMVEPTMDTIDFTNRVQFEPVASWVSESTLRVGWFGLTYCPSKPASISHDGSGNYTIELAYGRPPLRGICDAAGQVFIADFHSIPRPDSGESQVTLLGPEDGITQVVTVDS